MPAARASATASATSAGRAAARGAAGSSGSRVCAPNEIRVTPAAASQRVAALVGPGICLERDLGARREAEPRTDELEDRGEVAGRQQRRRAAAEIQRCRARRAAPDRDGRPHVASSASARSSISRRNAPRNAAMRFAAPGRRPRQRRRSRNTGQTETQNGMWT